MFAAFWCAVVLVARATVLLLLALAAALLCRRSPASLRRNIWAATLAGVVALPALMLLGPTLPVPVLETGRWAEISHSVSGPLPPSPPPPGGGSVVRAEVLENTTTPPPRIAPIVGDSSGKTIEPSPAHRMEVLFRALLAMWLAGIVVVGVRLAIARATAARLAGGATPSDASLWPGSGSCPVRTSDRVDVPLTVGVFRPVVLVPESGSSWSPEWRAMVVAHEIAHVRRRDPLFQLVADVACTLWWFHPLVWLAARRLRIERELAADDDVLLGGSRSSAYAELLIELAATKAMSPKLAPGAVVPILSRAGLKARLLGILDRRRRREMRRRARLAFVSVTVLVSAPVALALPTQRSDSLAYLKEGRVIGRVVHGKSKRPVANVEVVFIVTTYGPAVSTKVLSDENGWFRYPANLDSRGHFDLYARSGRLGSRKPVLAVPYGTELPVYMELEPAYTIAGAVRGDEGRPISGATLRFLPFPKETPAPGYDVVARTDDGGQFRIDGMYYGDYWLIAQAPWGVAETCHARVTNRDVGGLQVVIGKQWAVNGWLKDESGAPVRGAIATSFWPPEPWASERMQRIRYVHWDESLADGSFRLLPRGRRWSVRATNSTGQSLVGSFHDGDAVHRRDPYDVASLDLPEGRKPITVILRRGAYVSGVVQWQDGTAAAGAVVSSPVHATTGLPEPVFADEMGRFRLGPLEPFSSLTIFGGLRRGDQGRVQIESLSPGEERQGVTLRIGKPRPAFTPQ